jgi:hypothetical protein
MLSQPRRELRQVPQLAEVDSELDQAVLVQGQLRAPMRRARIGTERRRPLDGKIVSYDRSNAGISYPLK